MGLPMQKLVIAANENAILPRFWQTGTYEKYPIHNKEVQGGIGEKGPKVRSEGVKETLSPAMDILVSSSELQFLSDLPLVQIELAVCDTSLALFK